MNCLCQNNCKKKFRKWQGTTAALLCSWSLGVAWRLNTEEEEKNTEFCCLATSACYVTRCHSNFEMLTFAERFPLFWFSLFTLFRFLADDDLIGTLFKKHGMIFDTPPSIRGLLWISELFCFHLVDVLRELCIFICNEWVIQHLFLLEDRLHMLEVHFYGAIKMLHTLHCINFQVYSNSDAQISQCIPKSKSKCNKWWAIIQYYYYYYKPLDIYLWIIPITELVSTVSEFEFIASTLQYN